MYPGGVKGGIFMFKDKRFIMKTKFLLSVATLALFAACSDDSNSSAPENNVPGTDTPAVEDPSGNTTTDPAADPTKTAPASTDPAADPATTDPATDPATDPVTDPTTDPVETPDPVVAPEPYRLQLLPRTKQCPLRPLPQASRHSRRMYRMLSPSCRLLSPVRLLL